MKRVPAKHAVRAAVVVAAALSVAAVVAADPAALTAAVVVVAVVTVAGVVTAAIVEIAVATAAGATSQLFSAPLRAGLVPSGVLFRAPLFLLACGGSPVFTVLPSVRGPGLQAAASLRHGVCGTTGAGSFASGRSKLCFIV